MAVLLCFYVNKCPGATNMHPASCGKRLLVGSNVAIPPFLAQVEMDLKKHFLISTVFPFSVRIWLHKPVHDHRSRNLHLGSMGRVRERGIVSVKRKESL